MRDGAGQPAPRRRRLTGARATRWCVSVQSKAGRHAHCHRCMLGFASGEWRVAGVIPRPVDSKSHAGKKWLHPTCVDGPLPPAADMEGYSGLSVSERENLEEALAARGGPVLPLLDAAQEQAPVRPDQAAAAAGEVA